MDTNRPFAKKIFFLYPHSVVEDQMITLLIQSEYEVALINDYKKAGPILYRYPSSVIFINIESALDESGWEQFISELMRTREKHDARIGIVVYNPRPDLAQKYLMEIGVQCGFVGIKLGLADSARIILKTLEVNEAKGGRRYVRVKCPAGKASFNITSGGRVINGSVSDISSAGLSCVFSETMIPPVDFSDMQLSLWGMLFKLQGRQAGVRTGEKGESLFVVIFEELDRNTKGKIYTFIRKALQAEVDQ